MSNKRKQPLHPDAPLLHGHHKRPMSRREFIAQGLMAGAGVAVGPTLFSLFANPAQAQVELSDDLKTLKDTCGIATQGAGKIPFICFDLAGGANIAGSNVLAGGQGGQMEFLSTPGYVKMGLPGDMNPSVTGPNGESFINTELGVAFHSDSAFLRGILQSTSAGTRANTHGAIIPARSDNDTGNNPHNPMYGIARSISGVHQGADGELLTLIGSRSSMSGGNSMSPMDMIDPEKRPTKVDRPNDVTGLVDTGELVGLLAQEDAVAVLESVQRISQAKLGQVNTQVTADDVIKDLVNCGYVKSADLVARYGDPSALDPELDTDIVGGNGIFTDAEFGSDREFQKTASIMKMVINGYAGAGTVTMGGFDYHTGDRSTGELRDLRAGRCMGACLEYAARVGVPLMLYVFSDGSVASNGMVDDSQDGRGKGVWTGDNSSTAASFYLVYNPANRPAPNPVFGLTGPDDGGPQIGYFRADGSVETASSPAANNVNLLVQTVVLNYLALHGEQGHFENLFPGHGLGNATMMDRLTAFDQIVSGTITGS